MNCSRDIRRYVLTKFLCCLLLLLPLMFSVMPTIITLKKRVTRGNIIQSHLLVHKLHSRAQNNALAVSTETLMINNNTNKFYVVYEQCSLNTRSHTSSSNILVFYSHINTIKYERQYKCNFEIRHYCYHRYSEAQFMQICVHTILINFNNKIFKKFYVCGITYNVGIKCTTCMLDTYYQLPTTVCHYLIHRN